MCFASFLPDRSIIYIKGMMVQCNLKYTIFLELIVRTKARFRFGLNTLKYLQKTLFAYVCINTFLYHVWLAIVPFRTFALKFIEGFLGFSTEP